MRQELLIGGTSMRQVSGQMVDDDGVPRIHSALGLKMPRFRSKKPAWESALQ
jgi:hypothetical protein